MVFHILQQSPEERGGGAAGVESVVWACVWSQGNVLGGAGAAVREPRERLRSQQTFPGRTWHPVVGPLLSYCRSYQYSFYIQSPSF